MIWRTGGEGLDEEGAEEERGALGVVRAGIRRRTSRSLRRMKVSTASFGAFRTRTAAYR